MPRRQDDPLWISRPAQQGYDYADRIVLQLQTAGPRLEVQDDQRFRFLLPGLVRRLRQIPMRLSPAGQATLPEKPSPPPQFTARAKRVSAKKLNTPKAKPTGTDSTFRGFPAAQQWPTQCRWRRKRSGFHFPVPECHLTNLLEGDIAHFEATLRSRSDHDGRIIFNGQFLKLGPRERTVHAFGMVVLEIIGTKFKDSDIYTYRYSTTFISFFKYKDRYNIFENFWRAGLATNETWLKFGIRQAGHWLRPVGSHDSGGNICKSSVPTSLASLFSSLTPPRRIQWIHNGHQFGSGPRIRMLDDFGFVVLVIDWIFPLDARETVCRATNTGQSCLLSPKPSATSFWTAANPILGQVITAEKLRDLERGLVTERFTEDVPVKTSRFTL